MFIALRVSGWIASLQKDVCCLVQVRKRVYPIETAIFVPSENNYVSAQTVIDEQLLVENEVRCFSAFKSIF